MVPSKCLECSYPCRADLTSHVRCSLCSAQRSSRELSLQLQPSKAGCSAVNFRTLPACICNAQQDTSQIATIALQSPIKCKDGGGNRVSQYVRRLITGPFGRGIYMVLGWDSSNFPVLTDALSLPLRAFLTQINCLLGPAI